MALGVDHPDQLAARLTARQLAEWQAYYMLEPFGERRADMRTGTVAALLANIHSSRDAEPRSPVDFFPEYEPDTQAIAERKRERLLDQQAAGFELILTRAAANAGVKVMRS